MIPLSPPGNDGQCSLYCENGLHAELVTIQGGTPTREVWEDYAASLGCIFHHAREVIEVDYDEVRRTRRKTWNADTGTWSPYDGKPIDQVWLVWLSAADVGVVGSSLPAPTRFQRWRARMLDLWRKE